MYLPFVDSPLAVLEHMFPQNPGWNEAILGPEGIPILSEDTPYSNFLRVNLEDAKVSDGRSDLLKRHGKPSTQFQFLQIRTKSVIVSHKKYFWNLFQTRPSITSIKGSAIIMIM